MLTDGRTTDARVTGILIAHLGAFSSGELTRQIYFSRTFQENPLNSSTFQACVNPVTIPCGVLGQVWYLTVSIPDLCLLSYFQVYNRLMSFLQEISKLLN